MPHRSMTSAWSASSDCGLRVVESRRRPTGRQFQPVAEADLLPSLLLLAGTFARATQVVVAIPEFVGAFGVADLVALVADPSVLDDRLASGVPPLAYEPDAAIVGMLTSRASRSPEALASRLSWPVESIMRRVPHLVRFGAVTRTPRGLVRHPAIVPVGRLHALEAKVRDWRRGRDQARRYLLWADTSTLVLSRLPNAEVDIRGELGGLGVGLAVGDEWLRRPRIHRHSAARRLLASEMAVSALDAVERLYQPSSSA